MVRCKLPGAEWSGNILSKRKMRGEKLLCQLLFFDRNYDEFSAKWMISIVVDRRTVFEKKGG